MAKYSIQDTTLIAIGDAIRNKTGKTTKIVTIPVEQNTFNISIRPQDIDVTQLPDKDNMGNTSQYWNYTQDITVKGAVKFKVNYVLDTNLADSYAVYAFKENEKLDSASSVYCNPNGTTSGSIISTYHNKVRISVSINKANYEQQNYSSCDFEIIGLDADGNPVTGYEAEVANTMTPAQMAVEIDAIPKGAEIPAEAFNITGDCQNKFAYGGWDWFIDMFGNKVTTSNISCMTTMFNGSKVTSIPFEINISSYLSYMDKAFRSAEKLESLPPIKPSGSKIAVPTSKYNFMNTDMIFYGTARLREIPYDYLDVFVEDGYWEAKQKYGVNGTDSAFAYCNSLRKLPNLLPFANFGGTYYSMYDCLCIDCRVLDEITNLLVEPVNYTSNVFDSTVNSCYRLKDFTFETNEDGTPKVVTWKNQTIDLTFIGYATNDYQASLVTYTNGGITADKIVSDDASYQALKNDADWTAKGVAYSRYNHDSAVRTINSLPDVSAGSGNSIKFTGASGSSTDGGAINTLTEAEIAVAASKGWTVTLS